SSANLGRGLLVASMRKSIKALFLNLPAKASVLGSALRFLMSWLTVCVRPSSWPKRSYRVLATGFFPGGGAGAAGAPARGSGLALVPSEQPQANNVTKPTKKYREIMEFLACSAPHPRPLSPGVP